MTDVLVLNRSYMPVEVISDRDAVVMLYKNTAYSVVESEKVMRSPSITIRVPNVIALLGTKHVPKRKVNFSKLNVIYRDDMCCQYCGKQFSIPELTVDHIIPRSRWAKEKRTAKRDWSTWHNCVAACKWCNNAKGNKLLSELKWKLIRKTFEPEYLPSIIVTKSKATRKGWLPFCGYNVRLIYS